MLWLSGKQEVGTHQQPSNPHAPLRHTTKRRLYLCSTRTPKDPSPEDPSQETRKEPERKLAAALPGFHLPKELRWSQRSSQGRLYNIYNTEQHLLLTWFPASSTVPGPGLGRYGMVAPFGGDCRGNRKIQLNHSSDYWVSNITLIQHMIWSDRSLLVLQLRSWTRFISNSLMSQSRWGDVRTFIVKIMSFSLSWFSAEVWSFEMLQVEDNWSDKLR